MLLLNFRQEKNLNYIDKFNKPLLYNINSNLKSLIFPRGNSMKKTLLLLLISMSIFVLSCKIEIPIKEMNSAKSGIKRSYEVKADKYDPENLKKAEAFLLLSHDYLKKEDVKKAKDEAINSAKASETAINNSLPKLAADSLNEAQKAKDDLQNLNPEVYAAEEYKMANETLKKAADSNTSKQFWESYLDSKKAKPVFILAKELCLAALPGIKEKQKILTARKNELESSKWADEGKTELLEADKFLASAGADISAENLKSASANLTEAENKLNTAKVKILKISARESIAVMREEIKVLTQNRGNEFAEQELSSAAVSLNDADAYLTADDSENTSQKILEAEKILAAARAKINRGSALERIKSVENLFEKVKLSDKEKKFTADFDDAESILNESKKYYDESALELSMSKADESEALLNSISIALEKDSGSMVSGIDSEKIASDEKIYIVKYRKKNTDCLWRISLIVYKNARLWPLIYKANKQQIKDPDLIFPGQRFIIPPYPEKSIKKKDEKISEPEKKDQANENTVKPEEKKSEAASDTPEKKESSESSAEKSVNPEEKKDTAPAQ